MEEKPLVDKPLLHKPVLMNEVLHYLDPKPGGVYIDATFGSGGHTRAILEKEPTCTVIALDWDNASLETYGEPMQLEFGSRLRVIWGSFALLYKIVKKERIQKIDGILADFGTSQIQIAYQPGFSIYRDTPLDMRMSRSHYRITAEDIVNTSSAEKLRELFWQLGEERYARQIVDALVEARAKNRIATTGQLADIVVKAVSKFPRQSIHPATRVFQALRMYVNNELGNIEAFLSGAVNVLSPGGNLVCISFHSLEDRLVKTYFHDQNQLGKLDILTKKVVMASEQELVANPSSRSARLRAARIRK